MHNTNKTLLLPVTVEHVVILLACQQCLKCYSWSDCIHQRILYAAMTWVAPMMVHFSWSMAVKDEETVLTSLVKFCKLVQEKILIDNCMESHLPLSTYQLIERVTPEIHRIRYFIWQNYTQGKRHMWRFSLNISVNWKTSLSQHIVYACECSLRAFFLFEFYLKASAHCSDLNVHTLSSCSCFQHRHTLIANINSS